MREVLNKIKEGLADILFPRMCLGCGKEGEYICQNCEVFLSEVGPTSDVGTMSVWEYEGIIEQAIHKIKFAGQYDIINELVEKAMERVELNLPADTVITYVPMHKKRERERSFNQAGLLARQLGQLLGVAEQPMLEKVRDNRSQVGLSPKEREENVRGAFCVKFHFTQVPGSVLLVDDVYTTGATMNECIKTLKKAGGVKNIYGFTLARKLSL